MQTDFVGDFDHDYSIPAATNLADWTLLYATNAPALPFPWMDINYPNSRARFFRARLSP